jgi:hypothetical protein
MTHWFVAVEADNLSRFEDYMQSIKFDDSARKEGFIKLGIVPPVNVKPVVRELRFYDIRFPSTCEDQLISYTLSVFPYSRITKVQKMLSKFVNNFIFKRLLPGFSLVPTVPKNKTWPPFRNPREAGQAMMIPICRVEDNDDMFGI